MSDLIFDRSHNLRDEHSGENDKFVEGRGAFDGGVDIDGGAHNLKVDLYDSHSPGWRTVSLDALPCPPSITASGNRRIEEENRRLEGNKRMTSYEEKILKIILGGGTMDATQVPQVQILSSRTIPPLLIF